MRQLEGRRVLKLSREIVYPLAENHRTLREHYRRKRERYEVDVSKTYDRRLVRIFGRPEQYPKRLAASRFLRGVTPQLRRLLVRRARMHPYLVDYVLRNAIHRARHLDLRLKSSQRVAKRAAVGMLERIMLDMLLRDRENFAL
jgi:hypothetical protein